MLLALHYIIPSLTWRMLFIDYSSAFNTVIPQKLSTLCLHPTLYDWLLDFLIATVITNIGTP